jgi:hypothetical protein
VKKAYFIIILLAVIIVSGILIFGNNPAQAPTVSENNPQNNQPAMEQKCANLPLAQARDRVLKKPFGIKIDPKASPVQPEKFSGYHTGTDYEIIPGEENIDVAVNAVCDGKLLQKRIVSGYGGVIIQSCSLSGQNVTVLYGHIKLTSVSKNVGDAITQGEQLAILGKGYSTETDRERKHLHLGIHKGAGIVLLGYVQSQQELANWLDFEEFVKSSKF